MERCRSKVIVIDNRRNYSVKYETKYSWLYYSSAKSGYLCKYCEFLNTSGSSNQSENHFVSTGTQLGDHPSRKLQKHDNSENHKVATKMNNGESIMKADKSVYERLRDQNANLEKRKRSDSAL